MASPPELRGSPPEWPGIWLEELVDWIENLTAVIPNRRQHMELTYTAFRASKTIVPEHVPDWLRTEVPALGGQKPIDIIMGHNQQAKDELQKIISELESPGAV